jgi:hypothetical protein
MRRDFMGILGDTDCRCGDTKTEAGTAKLRSTHELEMSFLVVVVQHLRMKLRPKSEFFLSFFLSFYVCAWSAVTNFGDQSRL